MSTTYNAKVYMEQGSTRLVCTTGGEIEMRTGSRLDQKSGSSANLDGTVVVGGAMSFSSAGGGVRASSGAMIRYESVRILTTKGSTAETSFLHNYGIDVIRPNGTAWTGRLKRPVKGVLKTIIFQSTLVNKVSCTSTAVNFGSTATPQHFSFTYAPSTQTNTRSAGYAVGLVGLSSSVWAFTGSGGLVASSLMTGVMVLATAT